MAKTATTGKSSGVDTRGWDTVSAVHIADLNFAVAAAGTTPPGFDETVSEDSGDVAVSGRFDPWSITPDGDSSELTMMIPVRDLRIVSSKSDKGYLKATANITVTLELLPHEPDKAASGGTRRMLLVVSEPRSDQPISVDDTEITGTQSLREKVRFGAALEKWLNKHIRKFTHVFAAITLNDVVEETAAYAWMKPTYVAYAFGRNAQAPDRSILAVLAQTQKRSAEGLSLQVEQAIIPDGESVGYAISRDRLLENMIADALPSAFDGLKRSDIKLDLDKGIIELKEGVYPHLDNIENDGDTYKVDLESLRIQLDETSISVASSTRTRIAAGAYSICDASGTYTYGMTRNKAGEPTIGLIVIDESEPEHRSVLTDTRHNIEKWLARIALVLAAIVLLIVAICWLLVLGVPALIVGCLLGLSSVAGGAALIMHLVELWKEDDGPPLDILALNDAAGIGWSIGAHFVPTQIHLNGALQFGGFFAEDPVIDTITPLRSDDAQASAARAFQAQFADRMGKRAA